MNRLLLGVFLLVSLIAPAQEYHPSEEKLFDLIHTKLDLQPDWSVNQMKGHAELTLKPWFYPQDQLLLDAKGFTLEKVSLNGKETRFEYDNLKLKVHLDRVYKRTDTLLVTIDYIAKPDELNAIPAMADSQFKGLYFVNGNENKPSQIWTEGETEYNSCWFPTLDSPNQKHTQEISLTVPKEYITLSNGALINSTEHKDGSRTDTWQQSIPHSVYLTMIAAGPFKKVIDQTFKDFEVSYYVEPEYEQSATSIFGRTPETIRYFETLLNVKYPWNKYAQIAVRDYISGAMENTTATVHGNTIQKFPNQLVDENDDGVIAHELFHHWFGDLVTAESWANLPLNEAFANYSEYLWAEKKYGKDEGDWVNFIALNQYLNEADLKQVPVIRYHYADKEDMFDSHSYAKGGRILHMLRQEVGDEAFFKSLQVYLEKNRLQNAEISNLRMAFEEVTGRDLNWFFDQWFMAPGHPRIHVTHSYQNGELTLSLNQQLDSLNSIIYDLPLSLEIGTKDGITHKSIRLNKFLEEQKISLDEAPTYVKLDPDGYALAVIDEEQTDEELYAQYSQSESAIARAKALESLTRGAGEEGDYSLNPMFEEQKRNLALAALKDPFWRIRDMAVQKFFDYDGEDFLTVERTLQSLIRTDEKSQVRASAILAMKNFLNPQNDLLFRKALADTSWLVRASALEAILINEPPDADSLVNMMQDIPDVNIFSAVANYKAAQAKPEDYEWFIRRISELSGMELYQVMGVFGSYLVSTNQENQLKSIPFLKNLALHESVWVARFAATQALTLLTELPEAVNALKEIIATEKNERLQSLYEQIRLE